MECLPIIMWLCATLMIIFILVGNVLILRSIYKNKELQTPTNYFLASLAVADLLITLCLPIYAVSTEDGDKKLPLGNVNYIKRASLFSHILYFRCTRNI